MGADTPAAAAPKAKPRCVCGHLCADHRIFGADCSMCECINYSPLASRAADSKLARWVSGRAWRCSGAPAKLEADGACYWTHMEHVLECIKCGSVRPEVPAADPKAGAGERDADSIAEFWADERGDSGAMYNREDVGTLARAYLASLAAAPSLDERGVEAMREAVEGVPHWFACRVKLRDGHKDKGDGQCDCDRKKLTDALATLLAPRERGEES